MNIRISARSSYTSAIDIQLTRTVSIAAEILLAITIATTLIIASTICITSHCFFCTIIIIPELPKIKLELGRLRKLQL